MKQGYSNVISQLKKQADTCARALVGLLDDGNKDEKRLRDLLGRYEEALLAVEILERQTYEIETDMIAADRQAKTAISNKLKKMEFVPAEETELQIAIMDTGGKVSQRVVKPIEGKGVVIGRKRKKPITDVGLVLNDDSISSRHCEICWMKNKGWVLIDYGTTNGTLLNGEPVTGEKPLPMFGVIHIGESLIKVYPKEKEQQFIETMRFYVE